jgi:glutamine synthetase
MYTHGHTVQSAKKLPMNLLDALRAFSQSTLFREALGEEFAAAYVKLKTDNWNDYSRHLTAWERDTTLDC